VMALNDKKHAEVVQFVERLPVVLLGGAPPIQVDSRLLCSSVGQLASTRDK
jgi:hypothetical protein